MSDNKILLIYVPGPAAGRPDDGLDLDGAMGKGGIGYERMTAGEDPVEEILDRLQSGMVPVVVKV